MKKYTSILTDIAITLITNSELNKISDTGYNAYIQFLNYDRGEETRPPQTQMKNNMKLFVWVRGTIHTVGKLQFNADITVIVKD